MKNNKGFTLAEMLIVVAIIGILISVVMVSISNVTEKAREATDLANIRTACSEINSLALLGGDVPKNFYKENNTIRTCVKCVSTKDGWQTKGLVLNNIAQAQIAGFYCGAPYDKKQYIRITIDLSTYVITFQRESNAVNPLYK